MVRRIILPGSSSRSRSRRIFPFSISRREPTARSRDRTSRSIPRLTAISVRQAKSWSSSGATMPRRAPASRLTAPRRYRASKKDCAVCELKVSCCPNTVARKIPRDLDEDSRDVARALAGTPEFEAACRRRKKVEMLFAHLKRILRLGRLRLRGPCGAKDEFLLAATAQNLRRLARLRPAGLEMTA
ncbi:hypothetical protein AMST5_02460 [freshwater sediment metagenome]|uniref:Transposase DDE domain-containing protein n=1 Tax=freshwater sediment metagenome TaxID=556182 RepID=A0AA48RDL7_9ZZZZ